jgi:prefoldin subunit 5
MSTPEEQIAALQAQLTALAFQQNETSTALQYQLDLTSTAADDMWVILSAVLVFLMQGGFAMLEVGAVREKNVTVSAAAAAPPRSS